MWCPKVKSTDEDDAPGYTPPQSYLSRNEAYFQLDERSLAQGIEIKVVAAKWNLSNLPLETFERNALRRTCFGKGSSYRRDRDGAVVNSVLVGTLLLQSPDPTESSLVAAGK